MTWLISTVTTPIYFARDFNAKCILWELALTDKRAGIVSDVCAGFNIIPLNTGVCMQTCLGSWTSFTLHLAFCSPGLAVHLDWFFQIYTAVTTTLYIFAIPLIFKWILTCELDHQTWGPFTLSLILEDQQFSSLNIMVDYFKSSLLWAASCHIHQLSTILHVYVYPLVTDKCCDAMHAQKKVLQFLQSQPMQENLISFKHLHAKAQSIVCEAKHK
jgi:hypothetical protein